VRAKDQGVDLRLQTCAQWVRVLGDPLRLRRILVNLEANAIKFTERGEIVLGLDVDVRTAGAIQLRFRVRNSGIGIPAAQRSRIFLHFTEADSSTTP
jgi:two-component system, sensor histidine kinase and response regulator